MSGWKMSDAWLLNSTSMTRSRRRGQDLSHLIAMADVSNHSIPTDEEVRTGLGRLIASGLLREEAGKFRVTERGRELVKRVRGLGLFEQAPALLEVLGAEQPLVEGAWEGPPNAVLDAYEAYLLRWPEKYRPKLP